MPVAAYAATGMAVEGRVSSRELEGGAYKNLRGSIPLPGVSRLRGRRWVAAAVLRVPDHS